MEKSVKARLAALETIALKDLKAIVTFENGEKKRLDVIDIVLASLHGVQGKSPKVTNIHWLGEDEGSNGILPQLANYLIGADA